MPCIPGGVAIVYFTVLAAPPCLAYALNPVDLREILLLGAGNRMLRSRAALSWSSHEIEDAISVRLPAPGFTFHVLLVQALSDL